MGADEKIAVNNLAGIITADNSIINGNIAQDGTTAAQKLVQDGKLEEALAAAPKTSFTGTNEVNGTISNTYGVITVADGASLTADSIANNAYGFIDVAGKIDSVITGDAASQVSVKGFWR